MAFHKYTREEGKPFTHVVVAFPNSNGSKTFLWDALLDTGSPYTVLPGFCREALNVSSERLAIDLLGECHGHSIELPVRGRAAWFHGVGAANEKHLPFLANLQIEGFKPLEWRRVFFKQVKYAIIGCDLLYEDGTICFCKSRYRVGRCWRRFFCR